MTEPNQSAGEAVSESDLYKKLYRRLRLQHERLEVETAALTIALERANEEKAALADQLAAATAEAVEMAEAQEASNG